MSRFIRKIFAIKSRSRRRSNIHVKVFGRQFLGGTTPTFLLQIVSAIYRPPFGPPISRGADTPYFGHTFSNRTHFRVCGRFRLSELGGLLTKKI